MKYWRLSMRGVDGNGCVDLKEAEYLQEALRKRYEGRMNDRCVYAFPSEKRLNKPNTHHVFALITTENDVTEKDIVNHINHTFQVKVIPTTLKVIDEPYGRWFRVISLEVVNEETYKYCQFHCYTCDKESGGRSLWVPCPAECHCSTCDPAGN